MAGSCRIASTVSIRLAIAGKFDRGKDPSGRCSQGNRVPILIPGSAHCACAGCGDVAVEGGRCPRADGDVIHRQGEVDAGAVILGGVRIEVARGWVGAPIDARAAACPVVDGRLRVEVARSWGGAAFNRSRGGERQTPKAAFAVMEEAVVDAVIPQWTTLCRIRGADLEELKPVGGIEVVKLGDVGGRSLVRVGGIGGQEASAGDVNEVVAVIVGDVCVLEYRRVIERNQGLR